MAKLEFTATQPGSDPTLKAIDEAVQAKANAEEPRPYLGMSGIGHPCLRKSWYDFHWCSPKKLKAETQYKFDDGNAGEALMAARLRMVKGIELQTHDWDGMQFGFADIHGHFKGHLDGAIKGLLQAPKTPHVWEHKQVEDAKQAKLEKLVAQNEKEALKQWDIIYYAQAILYMFYSELTRHYLTCSSPGGRRTISVRTDASKKAAETLIKKAEHIIASDVPVDRMTNDPAHFMCKSFCDHADLCHLTAAPKVNCRTCAHSSPVMEGEAGDWYCKVHGDKIPTDFQRTGCDRHIYNPALLVNIGEPQKGSDEQVEYINKTNGKPFANGIDGYSSHEIHAADDKRVIGADEVEAIKKHFPGSRVVG
jgi:hypothetical protein